MLAFSLLFINYVKHDVFTGNDYGEYTIKGMTSYGKLSFIWVVKILDRGMYQFSILQVPRRLIQHDSVEFRPF